MLNRVRVKTGKGIAEKLGGSGQGQSLLGEPAQFLECFLDIWRKAA
jgi:hypothetical protein